MILYGKRGMNMEEVKVYVDCLDGENRGDLVRCSDCGELMLIQIGGTACGECASENLQWYDDNRHEWTITELEEAGFIVIEKQQMKTQIHPRKENNMKERVMELINQIGNSLDSPYYAEKILTECGKEILQIVGNLEEQIEILKRK